LSEKITEKYPIGREKTTGLCRGKKRPSEDVKPTQERLIAYWAGKES
jgi:hypothetical protein